MSDKGHRVLEVPGARPAKISGMFGATFGYLFSLPVSIVLLPTYPFEKLIYSSSPEEDVPMPILFVPMEIFSGVGAAALASPFLLINHARGNPPVEELTEWPPAREWPPSGEVSSNLAFTRTIPEG